MTRELPKNAKFSPVWRGLRDDLTSQQPKANDSVYHCLAENVCENPSTASGDIA